MILAQVKILKLDAVQVLALACFGASVGVWLKRKFPVLDRLNIPASIVGGLVYAVIALVLRDKYLNLEMDLVLREILMIAFFTTVGMSASLRLLKAGGVQVLVFFGLATCGAILQNLVGIGAAHLLGGVGIDAAVDFDQGAVAKLLQFLAHAGDLGDLIGHERLTAEARLDGHDQDQLHIA